MIGTFVCLVVLTNTVGTKLFVVGPLVLPVSIFCFPLTFWRSGDRVSVETAVDTVIDGEPVAAGHLGACESGTRIEVAGEAFQIIAFGGAPASTAADDHADDGPRVVRLEFLPRGARLYVDDAAAYLPERRAELMSLLLRRPEPYDVGDLVPDDLVLERLWPRQTKTTNDIHVLVHRTKKSLVGAGIDATGLIEREPRAGGTRFVVAKNAKVSVS